MFRSSRFRRLAASIAAFALMSAAAVADAAGVRGSGAAKTSEWKRPPKRATVRARALRRARLAALQSALEGIDGPVDPAAKKDVLRDGTRWTGAYRILSETIDAEGIQIELEVDVDLARLSKFVAPAATPAPSKVRYHVGAVTGDRGCDVEPQQIAADLERFGVAASKVGTSEAVDVKLSCRALGPVPNTLLQAVRIRYEAGASGRSILASDEAAFGVDEVSARERGAAAVAERLATVLQGEPGGVTVRVESPHPASRVRRLQRAMEDQVRGVRRAKLVGIEPDGAVALRLEGRASAETIASGLRALSLPDFSITIVGVHDSRGLTVRLR